jgi:sigma-B regulation protein RsbU (phosphoserine phosphatase)
MTCEIGSLLLVDDDARARAELRRYLTANGFEIAEAAGGPEALALAKQGRYDVVLLDVEMPGQSGLEVLRVLRQTHDRGDLPVMMATVNDSPSDVVEALRLGANDYVTKPFVLPVVLERVRTQWALKQATAELKRANQRMRQELEAASQVQRALLPPAARRLPGAEFAHHYRPCESLAGDLVGLVDLAEPTRVCLYVLDVESHGVKAALLAVMVNRVVARLLAERADLPPGELAARLHREFPFNEQAPQFFTLMLGVLDADAAEFCFISAGHPGPLLLPRGGEVRPMRCPGTPIACLWADGVYEEHRLRLEKGDRLYLYSDGLFEAMNGEDRPFGVPRCAEVLAGARGEPLAEGLRRLLAAVEAWSAPGRPHDDITVAAVELM